MSLMEGAVMIREMPPYPRDGSWYVYKMAGLLTSHTHQMLKVHLANSKQGDKF